MNIYKGLCKTEKLVCEIRYCSYTRLFSVIWANYQLLVSLGKDLNHEQKHIYITRRLF